MIGKQRIPNGPRNLDSTLNPRDPHRKFLIRDRQYLPPALR